MRIRIPNTDGNILFFCFFFTDSNSERTGDSVTLLRPEEGKDARTLGFQVGISLKRFFQLTTG
jgi:hypothetical protein